jgi:hypothetical protein
MNTLIRKEFKVAFSKRAQPVWFRVVKWAVFILLSVFFYNQGYFWPWIAGMFILSMSVHFYYRWKTKAWTQPYGKWDDVQAGQD